MYRQGTDLILGVVINNTFKALGYSSGCKISDSTETGERNTKEAESSGWKERYVKSLAEQVTADGFVYDGVAATSIGFPDLKTLWLNKSTIRLRYKYRDGEELYEGDFIITSLEQDGPADDDEKWSITFESTGAIGTSSGSGDPVPGGVTPIFLSVTEPQNFTPAQKSQARENIGAARSKGEEPELIAGDIVSLNDRVTVAGKFVIRTTADSESIDSGKDALLLQVLGGPGFKINALRWNGANALDPEEWAAGKTSGYLTAKISSSNKVASGNRKLCIVRTPKCEAGEYGTAAKNNGWLLTDINGHNLYVGGGTVVGVWHSATLPSSGTVVTAVTEHTFAGHSEKFYLPDEGYMIVELASSANIAEISAHLAWSKDYGVFKPYVQPAQLDLAVSPLTSVFDTETVNGVTCLVMRGVQQGRGGSYDTVVIYEEGGGYYTRNMANLLLTDLSWTETAIEGVHAEGEAVVSGYRYTASLPTSGTYAAMPDGFILSEVDGMSLEGTTLKFDSTEQINPSSAFSGKHVEYQMETPITGTHNINPAGKNADDMGTEEVVGGDEATGTIVISYMRGFKDSTRAMMNEFKKASADLEIVKLTQPNFCVGAWLDNANTANPIDLDNPDALGVFGNRDWARDWRPFLVDMTATQGEIRKRPKIELKKNNWLRDIYGNWAPVVGITTAMRNECMGNALYTDAACSALYCASGAYDPEEFLKQCTVETVSGVKKLVHPKLYKAADTEVGHYLMPWETAETKYSIFVGRKDKIYLLDNVVGASGKEWNGILGSNCEVWDGVDVKSLGLAPTGICPSPVTAVDDNGTVKLRSFYFNYPSAVSTANGMKGVASNCEMFYNKAHMPINYATQMNTKDRARANNYDSTKPFPVAEGGYHARNTFLRCVETALGSKNLCTDDRFGMSGSVWIGDEAGWRYRGGARMRKVGDEAWTYSQWGSRGIIAYNDQGSMSDMAHTLNYYAAHMPTLEAQMAVSFAVEFGIASGEAFEFNGYEFRYDAIVSGSFAPLSPAQGEMNCRVYKLVTGTFSAYNSDGTAQEFEVEAMVRTGLMLGCDMSADAAVYWGGGCEVVGECVTAPASGSYGHEITAFLEPDQEKWTNEADANIAIGSKFSFEDKYKRMGSVVTKTSNYTRRRVSNTPLPASHGGGFSGGECAFTYTYNYWGSAGYRTRIGLLCGDYSYSSYLSARLVYMYYAASSSYCAICSSAQVLLDVQ